MSDAWDTADWGSRIKMKVGWAESIKQNYFDHVAVSGQQICSKSRCGKYVQKAWSFFAVINLLVVAWLDAWSGCIPGKSKCSQNLTCKIGVKEITCASTR